MLVFSLIALPCFLQNQFHQDGYRCAHYSSQLSQGRKDKPSHGSRRAYRDCTRAAGGGGQGGLGDFASVEGGGAAAAAAWPGPQAVHLGSRAAAWSALTDREVSSQRCPWHASLPRLKFLLISRSQLSQLISFFRQACSKHLRPDCMLLIAAGSQAAGRSPQASQSRLLLRPLPAYGQKNAPPQNHIFPEC